MRPGLGVELHHLDFRCSGMPGAQSPPAMPVPPDFVARGRVIFCTLFWAAAGPPSKRRAAAHQFIGSPACAFPSSAPRVRSPRRRPTGSGSIARIDPRAFGTWGAANNLLRPCGFDDISRPVRSPCGPCGRRSGPHNLLDGRWPSGLRSQQWQPEPRSPRARGMPHRRGGSPRASEDPVSLKPAPPSIRVHEIGPLESNRPWGERERWSRPLHHRGWQPPLRKPVT